MDLQWRTQYQHVQQLVKKKLANLQRSWLSPRQKMRVINTSIRPMIRYTFSVAPYTPRQLTAMDSMLTAAAKAAHGLPTCASTAFAHNDVDSGGLGCASLQAEYHAILAECLIITINDQTTTGFITRALLKQQLAQANADKNPVTKAQMIHKAMRLRQLAALQTADSAEGLVLIQDGNMLQLDDVNVAARAFLTSLLNEELSLDIATDHPSILDAVRALAELKITTISHIVDVHTGMCMPASQMKTLANTTKVGYKHKKALNKLTILLNMLGPDTLSSGEYYTEVKDINHSDLPPDRRKVSAYATTHILAAKPTYMPIKIALERQARTPHQQTASVHIDLTHKKPRKQQDISLTTANIRAAPDLDASAAACEQLDQKQRHTNLSTGWDITKNIPPPELHASHGCYDKHTNQRWTLFNLYAAFDGDCIADVVAIQQATEKRVGSQDQVLVNWQHSVIPGWTAQLAKQLGYHPAKQRLATDEETMTQEVDTGCECCLLKDAENAESDLPTCSCCLRSYHTTCLPQTARDRWEEASLMDDADWYCQYCQQLYDDVTYTSAAAPTLGELQQALPDELRWYRMDWKPSPEPLDKIKQTLELQPEKHSHLLQKLSDLKTAQAAPPVKRHRTHGYGDLQLTNLQRQGIYLHAIQAQRRYDVTHGQDIRKLLTIHPDPINPQTDIPRTSSFQICVRKVESRHDGQDYSHEVACIHKPDGTTPYTLPVSRLKMLHNAYTFAKKQQLHNTH
jgi:hypothetical protein